MIDRLLDTARRAVDSADALWRREEHTTVAFESGRLKAAGITEESGINLRLVAKGRMGVVGTTSATPDLEALVARSATWRLVLRVGPSVFTPYVLVEVGP